MPCLLGCLALLAPRVVIIALEIANNYVSSASDRILWPILGFLFMPLTTLAYAFAVHENDGQVRGIYLVLVILAVLMDLGLLGGGGAEARRRRVR